MADKSKLSREELKKAAGGQSADLVRPDKTKADVAGGANADVLTDADLAGAHGGSGSLADRVRPDKSLVDPYVKPSADVAGQSLADVNTEADKAGS